MRARNILFKAAQPLKHEEWMVYLIECINDDVVGGYCELNRPMSLRSFKRLTGAFEARLRDVPQQAAIDCITELYMRQDDAELLHYGGRKQLGKRKRANEEDDRIMELEEELEDVKRQLSDVRKRKNRLPLPNHHTPPMKMWAVKSHLVGAFRNEEEEFYEE